MSLSLIEYLSGATSRVRSGLLHQCGQRGKGLSIGSILRSPWRRFATALKARDWPGQAKSALWFQGIRALLEGRVFVCFAGQQESTRHQSGVYRSLVVRAAGCAEADITGAIPSNAVSGQRRVRG